MMIYKIFRADEWQAFQSAKRTRGVSVDLADGFIHFSTAAQVGETAAKHFTAEDGLMLAAFDADALGAQLKWEVSRGGAKFPHLYRAMTLDEVAWTRPLPLEGDAHVFPEDMA